MADDPCFELGGVSKQRVTSASRRSGRNPANALPGVAGGGQGYELAAGACVLYPATQLHRVVRGKRHAAVGWAQSLVRDAGQREILFDLDTARRAVFEQQGKSKTFDRLAKTYANLLRLWAEP
jgi:PKHD-type hydroxylase